MLAPLVKLSLNFDQNVRGCLLCRLGARTQKIVHKSCHDMTELSEALSCYYMTFKSSQPMTQLSLSFDQNVRGRLL